MSDRHINVKKGMFQRSGGIYMSKSKVQIPRARR